MNPDTAEFPLILPSPSERGNPRTAEFPLIRRRENAVARQVLGKLFVASIIWLVLLGNSGCVTPKAETPATDRSAWMRQARWGVMTHYLADWRARMDNEKMSVDKWNELVDHFDVEGWPINCNRWAQVMI